MSRLQLTFERRPSEDDAAALSRRLYAETGLVKPEAMTPESVDPLAAFSSEQREHTGITPEPVDMPTRPEPWIPAPLPTPERRPFAVSWRILALVVAGLAVASAAAAMFFGGEPPAAGAGAATPAGAAAVQGRAVISSNPAGALVFVDGEARGATPIDLTLPAGVHTVQLQHGSAIRTLPL